MTVIINASNTSGLTFTSDTSGNVAIQSSGTTVATITSTGANAGIQIGATFAPAFSAYRSGANQSLPATTWTKVQCQTEEYDTNSNYDNATNYRFTPTVSGYYQFDWGGQVDATSLFQFGLYKNGTLYKGGNIGSTGAIGNQTNNAALVYLNGSTDYAEMYAYANASVGIQNGTSSTYFQACYVRSA